MTIKKQEGYIKTAFRIPPDVHAWLAEEAKRQDRSANSTLIAIIRKHIESSKTDAKEPSCLQK